MAKRPSSKKSPSPWFAVTVGILGLIAGYGFVMGKSGLAFAAAGSFYSCPMHKQVCKGMDCNTNPACASGTCSKDCPGNCNHPA